MTKFRVFLWTTLILLSASRLPGQAYDRPQKDIYIQPVVCNDGTISFFVVRAYLNVWNGRSPWVIQGWYEVKPGVCQEIGPDDNHEKHYSSTRDISGKGDDAVSLLAFAFVDSKGTWGAAKVPVGGAYESSNQQFCVRSDAFRYTRDSAQSDLPRECDRAPAGYYLIPASVAFYGYSFRPDDPGPRDYLHVKLGASDRAIPLGKQTPSGGAAQSTGTINDLSEVLGVIFRGPGSPRLRAPNLKGWLEVCAPPTVVKSQSWANPPTARTEALKEAIRRFISTHTFDGTHPKIRVTEPQGKFTVQEVTACPGDYYVEVNGPDSP